ncbi:MAG: hypothetical protein ACRD3M_19365, partial [Thermoanaerobaculia bacterium]
MVAAEREGAKARARRSPTAASMRDRISAPDAASRSPASWKAPRVSSKPFSPQVFDDSHQNASRMRGGAC